MINERIFHKRRFVTARSLRTPSNPRLIPNNEEEDRINTNTIINKTFNFFIFLKNYKFYIYNKNFVRIIYPPPDY